MQPVHDTDGRAGAVKAGRKKEPPPVETGGGLSLNPASTEPCERRDHDSFPVVANRKVDIILRKEVIQPQVPLRLPCYDLVPIKKSIFGGCEADFGCPSLSWLDGRCVQGSGTHSPRCC